MFTTEGVIDYYHDVSLNSGGKLVTAELPVHPNKLKTQINWNNYYDLNEADYPVDGLKFVPLIYGDIFNMTEMDPSQNEVLMYNTILTKLIIIQDCASSSGASLKSFDGFLVHI